MRLNKQRNAQVTLVLYVDDGLLMSISSVRLLEIINRLQKEFKITVGNNHYFIRIGLELKRNRSEKKLFIGQANYLKHIVNKFNMTEAKPVTISVEHNTHLSTEMSKDALIMS